MGRIPVRMGDTANKPALWVATVVESTCSSAAAMDQACRLADSPTAVNPAPRIPMYGEIGLFGRDLVDVCQSATNILVVDPKILRRRCVWRSCHSQLCSKGRVVINISIAI